ncbi:MAG TPA: DUF998 domain-containing protein [Pseudonocardiaceae bacterium]
MTTTIPAPAVTTRALLGCGLAAGPLYVTVSLAQAFTRDGFDVRRHAWSLLANGEHGWIQVTNLALTGVLLLAFAAGLRRALGGAPTAGLRDAPTAGGRAAPRLIGAFGASMVVAAAFRADPALGFPAGTPDGPGAVSWHGLVHLAAGGVGFTCLAIGCLVLGRRYAAEGRRRWAAAARVTGVAFLAGFAGVASGQGGAVTVLGFVAAVLLVFGWLTAVSADLLRATA